MTIIVSLPFVIRRVILVMILFATMLLALFWLLEWDIACCDYAMLAGAR